MNNAFNLGTDRSLQRQDDTRTYYRNLLRPPTSRRALRSRRSGRKDRQQEARRDRQELLGARGTLQRARAELAQRQIVDRHAQELSNISGASQQRAIDAQRRELATSILQRHRRGALGRRYATYVRDVVNTVPGTPDETGLQAAVDERNRLADVAATLPTQGNLQELDSVLTQMRVDEARRDMMNSNTVVPDDASSGQPGGPQRIGANPFNTDDLFARFQKLSDQTSTQSQAPQEPQPEPEPEPMPGVLDDEWEQGVRDRLREIGITLNDNRDLGGAQGGAPGDYDSHTDESSDDDTSEDDYSDPLEAPAANNVGDQHQPRPDANEQPPVPPAAAAAAGANDLGNDMNNAANVLGNIEQRMERDTPEQIARLTQEVENDPTIKRLIARGVIKYSDLLNRNGTVNAPRIKRISEALAKRGLAEKGQASQMYNMYARQQTTPGFKSTGLPSGLKVYSGPKWVAPQQHTNSLYA